MDDGDGLDDYDLATLQLLLVAAVVVVVAVNVVVVLGGTNVW